MSGKLILVRILYWLQGLSKDPVRLFEALGIEASDRLLEIGCAIGYHTLPLARLASSGKVYAVDIWEEGLAYLKSRIGAIQNVEVICGSAEAVEFPPAALDKVVCFDTLHDVPYLEQVVKRWVEFLKPGGKVLYRDPQIPPEKIEVLSEGRLFETGMIQGVHVFVRR